MIIKTRIAAGGTRSYTRIPRAAAKMENCVSPGTNKLDPAKAMAAFSDNEDCFTLSSRDNGAVYWTAMTLLENLESAYNEVVEDNAVDCTSTAERKEDALVARRMERGKYVYARVTISASATGASASVRVDNPHEVVGGAEIEAKQFCVVCLQILRRIQHHAEWLAVGADADIVARADELNQRADDRAAYGNCERRAHGYCSPAKFDCKFYKDGRCCYGG